MSEMSDYLEGQILAWFRGTNMPVAPSLFVALYTDNPTDANTGTEVTTTIRAAGRPAVTFGAPSGNTIANSGIVDFGNAAGAPGGPVTHFAIFDAAAAGNMLMHSPLDASKTINASDPVNFPVGALTVSMD